MSMIDLSGSGDLALGTKYPAERPFRRMHLESNNATARKWNISHKYNMLPFNSAYRRSRLELFSRASGNRIPG